MEKEKLNPYSKRKIKQTDTTTQFASSVHLVRQILHCVHSTQHFRPKISLGM